MRTLTCSVDAMGPGGGPIDLGRAGAIEWVPPIAALHYSSVVEYGIEQTTYLFDYQLF